MIKRYFLEIEIAAIILLIFLLCLKFQKKAEDNEQLGEGEHQVVTVDEEGIVHTADGKVYFPKGYVSDRDVTPTPAATPTPDLTETERRLAALSQEDRERYEAATNLTIPQGIAFANVEESLSIRQKPDAASKQIGIMYPNNYCIVESVDGEWAKITTGNISGYCRYRYLVTGEEAQVYARETAVCRATTTANVNIRSAPTTKEDNIVTSVGKGKSYSVIEPAILSDDPDAPLFTKVQNGSKVCYIALGKVKIAYAWTAGKAYQ